MNLLAKETSRNLSSTKVTKPFRKGWIDFVDKGLHLCLPDEKVKETWRLIYRYNLWRLGGTIVGSVILTLLLQSGAAAQKLGEKAEKEINNVFGTHLTGASDAVSVSFSAGRFLVYVVIGGTIIMAFWDLTQNRGGHVMIWGSILGSIAIGFVIHSMLEKALFGA